MKKPALSIQKIASLISFKHKMAAFWTLVATFILFFSFSPHSSSDHSEPVHHLVEEQKSFVVLIGSYNNAKWCHRNLASVVDQDYDNFRVLYYNDCSKDDTGIRAEKFLKEHDTRGKVTLINNPFNRGALANYYEAIHSCRDDEIIVLLDGDDWFPHDWVLKRLNEVYSSPDVWLTYGSYIDFPTYQKGGCASRISSKTLLKGNIRKRTWRSSHLKTFYAGLFKQIALSDLFFEGETARVTNDMALMFPMIEMASTKAAFVEDFLYIYNRVNPISDDKVNQARQRAADEHFRNLHRYEKLSLFPSSSEVHPSLVDLLVFSYNRPLQLYATLESIELNGLGIGQVSVIYRCDGKEYEKAYQELKTRFPAAKFVLQQTDPTNNFRNLVLKEIKNFSAPFVCFAVDDALLIDTVDFGKCSLELSKTKAKGFFLRLGKEITSSYMNQEEFPLPKLTQLETSSSVLAWQLSSAQGEWHYPHNLDFTIYSKEKVIKDLSELRFNNPNSLEGAWAGKCSFSGVGLCFEKSKALNIPLNLVNPSDNRYMHSYSPQELLQKFNQGWKIDVKALQNLEHHAPHVEHTVSFVKK